MSKMKLNINARRTMTLYDINGKPYKLRKGSNDFCLEYKDYVALAKSLGITVQPDPDACQPEPAINTKAEDKESAEEPVNEQTNERKPEVKEAEESNELANESEVKESTEENIPVEAEAHDEESLDTSVEEPAETKESTKESVEDKRLVKEEVVETKESVDYTTWSYTKLKAEYKSITGKSCKLKKEEVIQFLQEQNNV